MIIPCHNEGGSLRALHAQLVKAFPIAGGIDAEFVFVDDASTDDSVSVFEQLSQGDPRLRVVSLAEQSGQTMALWEGLATARGVWVAHLDGDLQNDPQDLPGMLERAIEGGYDAVLGYRDRRNDTLSRRWASLAANNIRRWVLHDTIRDIGCSTRVVRREVLESLPPIPNQHRYLPALIERTGWRSIQVATRHHERLHGRSNYGNMARAMTGLRDLRAMRQYIHRVGEQRSPKDKPWT